MSKSTIETMLIICFFDRHGIVHKEFIPQRQTVNQQYYCEVPNGSENESTMFGRRLQIL